MNLKNIGINDITAIRSKKGHYKKLPKELEVKFGTKYIKVLSGGSAHSFIVNTDKDEKFKKGDILMAASWSTPARNFPRGNIFDDDYNVRWTGA